MTWCFGSDGIEIDLHAGRQAFFIPPTGSTCACVRASFSTDHRRPRRNVVLSEPDHFKATLPISRVGNLRGTLDKTKVAFACWRWPCANNRCWSGK